MSFGMTLNLQTITCFYVAIVIENGAMESYRNLIFSKVYFSMHMFKSHRVQGNGKQDRKIPKMPMCQLGPHNLWYRARNIGENKNQVHLGEALEGLPPLFL